MRLMLGRNSEPYLLVGVQNLPASGEYDPNNFKFYVVNGCWEGQYQGGFITIFGAPSGNFSSLDPVEILCSDQKRLRGEYNEVFANFDNPDYVGPEPKPVPEWLDDDIPF